MVIDSLTDSASVQARHLGAALPLNVVAHRGFSADFAARMMLGYLEAKARVAENLPCDLGCGKPATAVQPSHSTTREPGCEPTWLVVCVADAYDVAGLCEAGTDRLIYSDDLGQPVEGACVQCSLKAVWEIDFAYSGQHGVLADEFGCGGLQCLACGWRWNLPVGYVPSLHNIHYAECSFPAARAAVHGTQAFGDVRHLLAEGTPEPPLGSFLLDPLFRDAPDFG